MVANGVIGITAQIVESKDIGGGEQETPNMSLFERITKAFKDIRGNMKKMVGKSGKGIFYLLLAQSKITQGVIGSAFKLFGALLDIFMGGIAPFIVWIVTHLGNIIKTVQRVIMFLTESFKQIFGTVWEWIRDVAITAWAALGGIPALLGLVEGQEENADAEIEEFYKEKIVQGEMTKDDMETWAEGKSRYGGGLVEGGTMTQEDWQNRAPGEGRPNVGGGGEEGEGISDTPEELSWVYRTGNTHPPGGPIDHAMVEANVGKGEGKINLIDEEFNEDDRAEEQDNWYSWTDNIESFGWDDVKAWFEENKKNYDMSPSRLVEIIFGTGEAGTDGKDIVSRVLERAFGVEDAGRGSIAGEFSSGGMTQTMVDPPPEYIGTGIGIEYGDFNYWMKQGETDEE